jgi:heptosyltransferase-2
MTRPPDIVRAPNHLGDVVMALPGLAAAPEADVVITRGLAPLLTLVRDTRTIIPFARGAKGFGDAVRAIRARHHDTAVLLTPSFSSALMMRLAVPHVRGTATDGRAFLLRDVVPVDHAKGRSRPGLYMELVTGESPERPPAPRIHVPRALKEKWWQHAGIEPRPLIGIFPGGNAPSRRWSPDRFAAVADALAADHTVVVFGGPDESAVTQIVAGRRALDFGGRTDLLMLAAALSECHILISNDSGPLHLGAAVGVPAVALFGAGDPVETGVVGAAHTLLRHPELPCVPCVRNECPRRGTGYVLPEARNECLQLITVPDVLSAVRGMLPQ